LVYTDLLIIKYTVQGSHLWKPKTGKLKEHLGGGRETRFLTCHTTKMRLIYLYCCQTNWIKKLQIWITYLIMMMMMIIIINSYIQFTCWFLFTYLFLILRSLSPHSTITNLHIFLSFSYSFLLVAAWWLWYSCRCFLPPWESKNFLLHGQKCRYFHDFDEPKTFGIPNQIFWTPETEFFKTHKTRTSLGKLGQMWSQPLCYVSIWDNLYQSDITPDIMYLVFLFLELKLLSVHRRTVRSITYISN
jgi:hypothetical protein